MDIVGIYRVNPSKVQRNQSIIYTVHNAYIDMISFNRVEERVLKILDTE